MQKHAVSRWVANLPDQYKESRVGSYIIGTFDSDFACNNAITFRLSRGIVFFLLNSN
jgi:hypothetical protein